MRYPKLEKSHFKQWGLFVSIISITQKQSMAETQNLVLTFVTHADDARNFLWNNTNVCEK